MKYSASIITSARIVGAVMLLLFRPLSALFYTVYALCCVSDILDGYIARKTNTVSKLGETLDSIADFVLIAVMLVILIPLLAWESWMLWWVGGIALIRFTSLGVGFTKYRVFVFLHTYANKATGLVCALFPFIYQVLGLTITTGLLCAIASLSAIEELIISLSSKEIDRNTKGLFSKL